MTKKRTVPDMLTYDEVFEGYTEEDMRVMEIEEIFAAYDPAKRKRLKAELIAAVDRSDGSDAQKTLAKNVLNTVMSNVYLSNGRIEEVRWFADQIDIANRLNKLTGIEVAVDDPELRPELVN